MIEPRLYETMLNYQKAMQTNDFGRNQSSDHTYTMFKELFESYLGNQQSPVESLYLQGEQPSTMNQPNQLPFTHSSVSPVSMQQISYDQPSKFDDIIENVADQYGLDADLIRKVIQTESNFNPEAVSQAGAAGLMQLMPATARALGVTNVFDPVQNIEGGAKYLKDMINRYDGDLKLALAAYNAGPGNVDQHQGVPPFEETQNYVKKILG
ncbi:lytic transglycosylase domain-containing protein [Piscibacillus halophilus]|uniref:Transglycosylase SLT domain-containing protein n=1 Tax=Piscibacillus halophilus TaxID=571933 RepID=A0A1H9LML1_9BACI|nr:lytic transglycosylase domain-containing protein [Piscibacillus halophilus]SER12711.1 Transglycosylase SLT domain-containing protein [Piscibacillus halophilus]